MRPQRALPKPDRRVTVGRALHAPGHRVRGHLPQPFLSEFRRSALSGRETDTPLPRDYGGS
eukprot:30657-Pelagococcus_subviridis.AAC.3